MKKWKKWMIGIGCLIALVCIAGYAMIKLSWSKLIEVRDLADASFRYASDHNGMLPKRHG